MPPVLIILKLIMQSDQGKEMLVSAETIFCPMSLVSKVGCAEPPESSSRALDPHFPHHAELCSGKILGTIFCQWNAQEGIPALLPRTIKRAWKAPPDFKSTEGQILCGVVAICGNTSKTSQQGSSCHFCTKKAHLKLHSFYFWSWIGVREVIIINFLVCYTFLIADSASVSAIPSIKWCYHQFHPSCEKLKSKSTITAKHLNHNV